MAQPSDISQHTDTPQLEVRQVGNDCPAKWLRAGWQDLKAAPVASLSYGLVFALLGAIMVWAVADTQYLVLALITGFLLMGPLLAIGLYDISERIEAGEQPTLWHAMTSWRHRLDNIMMVAIIPGIIMAAWIRFSALMVGLFFNEGMVTAGDTPVFDMFLSELALGFWFSYLFAGGLLAAFVFSISVVSIPVSLQRNVDCISAMQASFRAVMQNKARMVLWAMAILLLTAIGFLTFGLGLVVVIPLIGHATWHAYRDLIA